MASPDPVLEAVGAALFRRRAKRGQRQADLAEHCDVDRAFISYIEHGQRNLSLLTLVCLAEALGCKPSDILRDAGL